MLEKKQWKIPEKQKISQTCGQLKTADFVKNI